MARSQETFNKREREKQRIKKQQDKQEKMKERKTNKEKGNNLEDMMAYLDENGNLTTTPPNPAKRRTFSQEDIQISVPKQEERGEDEPRTGTVTFFNDSKGFGFINDSTTGERIFVHVNNLSGPIKENDKVSFEVERSPKGYIAVQVQLIK
jgi:cold shock CspA family protein